MADPGGSTMRLYFFDLIGRRSIEDRDGVVFESDEEATELADRMSRQLSKSVGSFGCWTIIVRTGDGRVLCTRPIGGTLPARVYPPFASGIAAPQAPRG
jgi:hypothetical protein